MSKKISLLVIGCLAVGVSYYCIGKKSPASRAEEQVVLGDASPSKKVSVDEKPIRPNVKVVEQQSKTGTSKLALNLQMLAKSFPGLIEANPGVDFSRLRSSDPAFKNLKLPNGISFSYLHSAKCGRNSGSFIGQTHESPMGPAFDGLDSPKFESIQLVEDTTVGELESKLANDDCTIGVFPNGSIDSARIPLKADLEKALADHPVPNLAVYDPNKLLSDGYKLMEKSIGEGNTKPVEVYMAGGTAETFKVPEPSEASQAFDVASIAGGAGEVYILPLPSGTSPSEQIANANNSVLMAISRGADYVLLPALDPSVFSAVAQYAAEKNVKVYMVPKDVAVWPTALQPPRSPASSSTPAP